MAWYAASVTPGQSPRELKHTKDYEITRELQHKRAHATRYPSCVYGKSEKGILAGGLSSGSSHPGDLTLFPTPFTPVSSPAIPTALASALSSVATSLSNIGTHYILEWMSGTSWPLLLSAWRRTALLPYRAWEAIKLTLQQCTEERNRDHTEGDLFANRLEAV